MLTKRIRPAAFYLGITPAEEEMLRFIISKPAPMKTIVDQTGYHWQTVFKSLYQMKDAEIVQRDDNRNWFISNPKVHQFL